MSRTYIFHSSIIQLEILIKIENPRNMSLKKIVSKNISCVSIQTLH